MRIPSMLWFRTLAVVVAVFVAVALLPTWSFAAAMGGHGGGGMGGRGGGPSLGGGSSLGARGGGFGGASGFRGAPSIGGARGSFGGSGFRASAPMGGGSFRAPQGRSSFGGSVSRPSVGGQWGGVSPRGSYTRPSVPSQQFRAPMTVPRSYGSVTRQALPSQSLGQRRAPMTVPRGVSSAPSLNTAPRSFSYVRPNTGAVGRADAYSLYRTPQRLAQATPQVPTRQSRGQSMTRPTLGQQNLRGTGRAADLGRVVAQRPANLQPGITARTPQALARDLRRAPQADFRGPQAGRNLTPVTPQLQRRTAQQLTQQLRRQNAPRLVTPKPGVTRDAIGNLIPRDARFFNMRGTPAQRSFLRVTDRIGNPSNFFPFRPNWNWNGGWGWNSGTFWGSFFYPWYWSNPSWTSWWCPGYWPAPYSYWGWGPGWIYQNRGYYDPYAYSYVSGGYGGGYSGGYSYPTYNYNTYNTYESQAAVAQPAQPALDYPGVQQALADLRAAWVNSDITRLANHLTDQVDVQVFFDGKYTYSTKMNDYYAMTADTMATTRTVALDFNDPVWISTTEVFVSGTHVFDDPMAQRHTVYLSYRLRQLGSGWYLVAVGSSTQPITSPYQDFRTG